MRKHIHHLRLMLAVSVALGAVTAGPAAARFDNSFLAPPSAHPSTQASTNLCSEVCLSAITQKGAEVTSPYSSLPVAGPSNAAHHGGLTVVRVTRHGNGFAWDDAGIGAGVAIAGLALIGGAAAATATRRSRRLAQSGAPAAG